MVVVVVVVVVVVAAAIVVVVSVVVAPLPVRIEPDDPVRLGTNVTLTCDLNSTQSTATFSWSINDTPIPGSSPGSSPPFTVTSTPTQSTLVIAFITESQLGVVSCQASKPLHFPVTTSVRLTETSDLYLFGDMERQQLLVANGTTLVLECPVRSRSESTEVRWFDGDRLLSDEDKGVALTELPNGTAVATLGLATLTNDNGDMYMCEVRDDRLASSLFLRIEIYITSEDFVCCFLFVCLFVDGEIPKYGHIRTNPIPNLILQIVSVEVHLKVV